MTPATMTRQDAERIAARWLELVWDCGLDAPIVEWDGDWYMVSTGSNGTSAHFVDDVGLWNDSDSDDDGSRYEEFLEANYAVTDPGLACAVLLETGLCVKQEQRCDE